MYVVWTLSLVKKGGHIIQPEAGEQSFDIEYLWWKHLSLNLWSDYMCLSIVITHGHLLIAENTLEVKGLTDSLNCDSSHNISIMNYEWTSHVFLSDYSWTNHNCKIHIRSYGVTDPFILVKWLHAFFCGGCSWTTYNCRKCIRS